MPAELCDIDENDPPSVADLPELAELLELMELLEPAA